MQSLTLLSLFSALPLTTLAFPQFAGNPFVPRSPSAASPVLRRAAAPYSSQFPYTGATLNGGAGTSVGGVQVPAPGDYEHYYQDPLPGAQRGPCPGLNALANHGFISRDGITTYTELIAAMQNAFNVDYETSVTLAVLGIAYDGDPVTEMLSIGGDATLQTGVAGSFTGDHGGLARHGTFEQDVSLTRNDFYLYGDAASFNGTLFGMMVETAGTTSSAENPLFDFNAMALYRYQRYQQSRAENPYLYFPEIALHNYGAATFLYSLFPSAAKNYTPDLETISSFFGAVSLPDGTWAHQGERFPPGYVNRVTPFTLADISNQTEALYGAYYVELGGSDGVGNWVPLSSTSKTKRQMKEKRQSAVANSFACGVYNEVVGISDCAPQPLALLSFVTSKLNSIYGSFNCSLSS